MPNAKLSNHSWNIIMCDIHDHLIPFFHHHHHYTWLPLLPSGAPVNAHIWATPGRACWHPHDRDHHVTTHNPLLCYCHCHPILTVTTATSPPHSTPAPSHPCHITWYQPPPSFPPHRPHPCCHITAGQYNKHYHCSLEFCWWWRRVEGRRRMMIGGWRTCTCMPSHSSPSHFCSIVNGADVCNLHCTAPFPLVPPC